VVRSPSLIGMGGLPVTGTLTRGSPAVAEVLAAPGITEDDLVAFAAGVEFTSEHPLAEALVAEAKRRNVTPLSATNFEALPGRGAKALVEGKSVEVGGPRLLTEAKVTLPPDVEKLTTAWASDGKTVLSEVWLRPHRLFRRFLSLLRVREP
jgi:P-type Cu2+ transporter